MLRCAHHRDWYWHAAQHMARDGAQHQAAEARTSMRGHRHQLDLIVRDILYDLLGRTSNLNRSPHGKAHRAHPHRIHLQFVLDQGSQIIPFLTGENWTPDREIVSVRAAESDG